MPAQKAALFSSLSEDESRELLRRNHVGRLCFVRNGQPDITPVHYVADGPWIFVRSAPGAKMDAVAHHPYVAFEVDEISGALDWQSVVARGTIYHLPGDGTPIERRELERASRALRSLVPEAFTESDPTPQRQIVYGIHVDEMTGRMAGLDASAARG